MQGIRPGSRPRSSVRRSLLAAGFAALCLIVVGTAQAADPVPAADQDWYALELGAGDTVFLSLDLDPDRDGTSSAGSASDPGTSPKSTTAAPPTSITRSTPTRRRTSPR